MRCGSEVHLTVEIEWINCQGVHMANSRGCTHYRFRCEILATETCERITYREAEETVRTHFMEDGKTYSVVTGRTNKIQNVDKKNYNTETDGSHGNEYQKSLNLRGWITKKHENIKHFNVNSLPLYCLEQ